MSPKAATTNIIDHIVHLTPPGSVKTTIEQFTSLGFNVIPGGVHADGLTENALVILADGAYIELISFTHPVSYYPPNSPERAARESHPWSEASGPGAHPGWIDFAFLGLGTSNHPATNPPGDIDLSDVLNERAKHEGSGVQYLKTIPGGRVRPDGRELRWKITAPDASVHGRGFLPFFCGDVTERRWRVPLEPTINVQHPNTTRGLAHIRFILSPGPDSEESIQRFVKQVTTVVGHPPSSSATADSTREISWELITPNSKDTDSNARSHPIPLPRLILGIAKTDEELDVIKEVRADASGGKPVLFEIALWAEKEQTPTTTPFGRIRWFSSQ